MVPAAQLKLEHGPETPAGSYVPALHSVHGVSGFRSASVEPALHKEHKTSLDVVALTDWYVPNGHVVMLLHMRSVVRVGAVTWYWKVAHKV